MLRSSSALLKVPSSLTAVAQGTLTAVGMWPPLGLPLDPSAVDQLHLVVAVVLERPVRVRGEPVVVVAVEQDGVARRRAALAQLALQRRGGGQVAHGLFLEVLLPVPADRPL